MSPYCTPEARSRDLIQVRRESPLSSRHRDYPRRFLRLLLPSSVDVQFRTSRRGHRHKSHQSLNDVLGGLIGGIDPAPSRSISLPITNNDDDIQIPLLEDEYIQSIFVAHCDRLTKPIILISCKRQVSLETCFSMSRSVSSQIHEQHFETKVKMQSA
ncbi:hypothetical protein SCHPADRAFT_742765 [Schizopora paradoxa]|uniref:Uncharacterized protein n=1 Tax=Schizopora paradoxa TaxID=27342 RepID=A0A0H2R639_9AGAM|nr:hypothetical protein SCHPADRAFT_742765 [Schizopora paradoxa]